MKVKILGILITLLSLSACTDYLDLVPEKDILTIESIFEKEATAKKFLLTAYQGATEYQGKITTDPAVCGSDEFNGHEYFRNDAISGDLFLYGYRIAQGLNNTMSPVFNKWGNETAPRNNDFYLNIRHCNTFIARIDDVYDLTPDEKAEYKAEAKAIKAWYYFQLIKTYGPIVLMPENIDVNADITSMQLARSPIDECFNACITLLDEAILHIDPLNRRALSRAGFLNREACYAYKAKILMYAASPLFNGNDWYSGFNNRNGKPLFSQSADPQKWEKAAKAIDEAIEYCEANGRELIKYNNNYESDVLNVMDNIMEASTPLKFYSSELIWGASKMDAFDCCSRIPRRALGTDNYSAYYIGALNPSMRMVEMFYTENGLPLDNDRTYGYENRYELGSEKRSKYENVIALNEPLLNLHIKREPRFYANIIADKTYYRDSQGNFVRVEAKQGQSFGNNDSYKIDSDIQHTTGYWTKKMVPDILYDNPSSVMNFNMPYAAMRLADLYLMQAEIWNEHQGPSQKVYDALDKVRSRAGIPNIQDAYASYAKNSSLINDVGTLREIIHQERSIEFAFESHRYWDLRRWRKAHLDHNEPLKGWNTYGSEDMTFYNNYNGPLEVYNKNHFEKPRDYFSPIPTNEIFKSNIVQNLGW